MQSMSTRWPRIHVSGRMRASPAHTLPPNSFLEHICEPCPSTCLSMYCQQSLCTGTALIFTAQFLNVAVMSEYACFQPCRKKFQPWRKNMRLPWCVTGKPCLRRMGWLSGQRFSRAHFAAAPSWVSTARSAGEAPALASKPLALPPLLSLPPHAGQVALLADQCCLFSHTII